MRALPLIVALAIPLASVASPAPGGGEEAVEAEQKTVEEEIQELEAKRAALVSERDAARMRANTYVLPKDRLEAIEKQEEIDEIDRELEALRSKEAPGRKGEPSPR